MKWEPQRFDDEPKPQPPKKPLPYFPYFPPKKPDYLSIIARVLSIIVNILVIIFILMLINGAQDLQQSLGKKEEKDLNWAADKQYKPNTRFIKSIDDFIGYEEVKNQLKEYIDVVNGLTQQNLNPDLPGGILLHGPPGTGKTFLAKCLADSVVQKAPFFITTGSDFVEKYVGVGASRVRSLFKTAKKTAINANQKYFFIFIDEIDALGGIRSNDDNKNQEQNQTLNALLAEIDGFISSDQTPQPIIIGATNRIDILDSALIREGRLGKHILLNLPDLKTTELLLKKKIPNINSNSNDIAKVIHGAKFSPAQIIALAKEVKKNIKNSNNSINIENIIYDAMDFILMGAKTSSSRTDEETKRIITHELGHAILAKTLGFEVHRVTIEARGKAGGYTIFFPKNSTKLPTKMDLIKQIIVALGGRAAEEIIFENDKISVGCGNDLGKAYIMAKEMVITYGMSLNDDMSGINPLNKTIPNENQIKKIEGIIQESYKIAKKILEGKKNDFIQKEEDNNSLYSKIKENKTLNKDDFSIITQQEQQIKIDNGNLNLY
ncbi:ATP-dependent Zn metalloprotease [Candidatus Phytoplasma solani]|uniref:AAA family ATPase n=1 Tax=Candidatus Phytoplasma solani TaxID=69896 RepID=UPI0032DAC1F4